MRTSGCAACVAVLIASCSSTTGPTTVLPATTTATSAARASALKPIDQKRFEAVVAWAANELMVPAAVVLLRTPQGDFTAAYGTTELGTQAPPAATTHFRIASNTKT